MSRVHASSPRCESTLSRSLDSRHVCSLLPAETSDPSRQLHVLGHDGDALAMDGTEVAVLEETDEMCFRGFLQSEDGSALPTVRLPGHVGLDLADEPGERKAADQ